MKYYTVCLCYDYSSCKETTERLCKKSKASGYTVEAVGARCSMVPGYRGRIYLEEEKK